MFRNEETIDAAPGRMFLIPICKRPRFTDRGGDSFDVLPDDLLLSILSSLGSAASRPADFVSVMLT